MRRSATGSRASARWRSPTREQLPRTSPRPSRSPSRRQARRQPYPAIAPPRPREPGALRCDRCGGGDVAVRIPDIRHWSRRGQRATVEEFVCFCSTRDRIGLCKGKIVTTAEWQRARDLHRQAALAENRPEARARPHVDPGRRGGRPRARAGCHVVGAVRLASSHAASCSRTHRPSRGVCCAGRGPRACAARSAAPCRAERTCLH